MTTLTITGTLWPTTVLSQPCLFRPSEDAGPPCVAEWCCRPPVNRDGVPQSDRSPFRYAAKNTNAKGMHTQTFWDEGYLSILPDNPTTCDGHQRHAVTCHAFENVEIDGVVMRFGRDGPSSFGIPDDHVGIRAYCDPALKGSCT